MFEPPAPLGAGVGARVGGRIGTPTRLGGTEALCGGPSILVELMKRISGKLCQLGRPAGGAAELHCHWHIYTPVRPNNPPPQGHRLILAALTDPREGEGVGVGGGVGEGEGVGEGVGVVEGEAPLVKLGVGVGVGEGVSEAVPLLVGVGEKKKKKKKLSYPFWESVGAPHEANPGSPP